MSERTKDAMRRGDRCRVFRSAFLIFLRAALASVAGAQTITEFPLADPHAGTEGITAGPDGNVWFTDAGTNAIGRITPAGVVTEFPLPTASSEPSNIVAGPDGNLWFTEQIGKIGRMTTSGTLAEFDALSNVGLPTGITVGPDGNLWYTDLLGMIARITPAGVATVISPAGAADAGNSIVTGPDGNLWFTETHSNTIGRITVSGVVSRFPVPTAFAGPNNITVGPDGNLWFTEDAGNVGRITTAGVVAEFSPPTSMSFTDGIAAGPDGNVWFTEYSGGSGLPSGDGRRIGKITPAGEITEIDLPTPACGPNAIAAGPDRNLWVSEQSARQIARIVPAVPCSTQGTTLCLGGGRFQAQAHWENASMGASGDGSAVSLSADSGYFWFFGASNVEVIVKVLNACSLDGKFWVFAAGLTDVGVTLTVTDTQTVTTKTYTNSAGSAFQPVQDTSAFATCP